MKTLAWIAIIVPSIVATCFLVAFIVNCWNEIADLLIALGIVTIILCLALAFMWGLNHLLEHKQDNITQLEQSK